MGIFTQLPRVKMGKMSGGFTHQHWAETCCFMLTVGNNVKMFYFKLQLVQLTMKQTPVTRCLKHTFNNTV